MTEKNDILKDLFSRMPEEELPASFRANAMRQIMAEAERIRKRNERWGWIAVIAASLLMVGIAIASFLYMNISPISVQTLSMPISGCLPSSCWEPITSSGKYSKGGKRPKKKRCK